jgi:ParB family protein of integrating conjugative element (PFGI_1 class)
MATKLTPKQIQEMTKRAMQNRPTENNAVTPPPKSPTDLAFEVGISVIRLKVIEVAFFDKNPRKQANPLYTEIRDSIEDRGLDQSLQVTKRPGDKGYTLAKGGKTRLLALQELARTNPEKWAEHDFLIVPYVSEAELLAAHLVENIQRADMTFVDTAQGIVSMQEALTQEAGKALSQRDFSQALKTKGLDVGQAMINDCLFVTAHYAGLGEMTQKIARNDVRNTLRPGHTLLNSMWTLHAHKTEGEFDSAYHEWVGNYPITHAAYDPHVLQTHLQALASAALGYTSETFDRMLQALRLQPQSTLPDLVAPPSPSNAPSALGNHDDQTDHGEPDHGEQVGNDGSDDGDQNDAGAVSPEQGLQNLSQTLSGGGQSGLRVAQGLVPNKPSGGHNDGDFPSSHYEAGHEADFGQNASGGNFQPDLSGLSPQEIAHSNLQAALEQFADVAGVGQLVQSSGLRYGFYMELPQPEFLGVSHEDLPVQAWWFLANMSGQLLVDDGVLDASDANGFLIPDTGDQGYKFAASNEEVWPTAVVERLGGVTLLNFDFVHHLLTHPGHPLGDAAYALFNACRSFLAAEATKGV